MLRLGVQNNHQNSSFKGNCSLLSLLGMCLIVVVIIFPWTCNPVGPKICIAHRVQVYCWKQWGLRQFYLHLCLAQTSSSPRLKPHSAIISYEGPYFSRGYLCRLYIWSPLSSHLYHLNLGCILSTYCPMVAGDI